MSNSNITNERQSTNELDDCQVELGRRQFLEDKEKRKKRIRHLDVECQSQQKQGNNGSVYHMAIVNFNAIIPKFWSDFPNAICNFSFYFVFLKFLICFS